jgi:hypothetical protein
MKPWGILWGLTKAGDKSRNIRSQRGVLRGLRARDDPRSHNGQRPLSRRALGPERSDLRRLIVARDRP